MEVSVETTTGLERRMSVQVPEESVSTQVDERLRGMVRTAQIPGFRPGKVPLKVITKRYAKAVRDEVVGELVQSSFYDAITKEELRPAGGPVIDPLEAKEGGGISYTALFEVYPTFDLSAIDGLAIARPTSEVVDGDIDNMIETLRKQRREFADVVRASADGDRVTINFDGSVDGEPFEGGSAKDFPLELGSSSMIPGFETGVTGMATGESKTIDVDFPEDYGAPHLAGKSAQFAIEVTKVEESVLPEVNDEFVAAFGVGEGTVESFRTEVRGNMERELGERLKTRTKELVMDQLLESNSVELPKALIEDESSRLLGSRTEELRQQGYEPETLGMTAESFEPQARRRVALGLLLAEIIRSNGLAADQDKVREVVQGIASTFEQPEQVISYYYGDRNRLAEIESSVLEDQVVDLLLERAQVTEEKVAFDDLMNPVQNQPQA
jgi:trigger factor